MSTPKIENRDYFEVFEDFLRMLQGCNVTSVAMVALTDDKDTHDICAQWQCGPFELATCASVLQMHANYEYIHANDDPIDENDQIETENDQIEEDE